MTNNQDTIIKQIPISNNQSPNFKFGYWNLIIGYCLVIVSCILVISSAFAEESQSSFEDRAIAVLLKSMARGFTAVADIEKIKRDNIAKIRRMDDEKFRKRCARIYGNLKDMPPAVRAEYNISSDMTKDEAINGIQSLDKKKIYAIIEAAPDEMLAAMFKRHAARSKQEIQSGNFAASIRAFWAGIVKTVTVSRPVTPVR